MATARSRKTGAPPPGVWAAGAARDRLSSTAFLAALAHGILILGITFKATDRPDGDGSSTLEVVLLTSQFEDRTPPDSAVLLAQKSLAGAGNAPPDALLRTAPGSALPTALTGPLQAGGATATQHGQFEPFRDPEPVLVARSSPLRAPDEGRREQRNEQELRSLPAPPTSLEVIGRLAEQTEIPDAQLREFLISANTRESRIAAYLSVWKRKVEQVGTLNFPREVEAAGPDGYPVLEVAINADGSLRNVVLRSSSGQHGLDQAAMEILRLAAPFEPFPEALRSSYDVLRFAYEWRFSGGATGLRTQVASR